MGFVTNSQLKQVEQTFVENLKNSVLIPGESVNAQSIKTNVGVNDKTPFSAAPVGINSDVTTTNQTLNGIDGVNVVKNQTAPTISTSNWTKSVSTMSFSASDGVGTFTAVAQGNYVNFIGQRLGGHTYFVMCDVKLTTGTDKVGLCSNGGIWNTAAYGGKSTTIETTSWQTLYGIMTIPSGSSGSFGLGLIDTRTADWDAVQFKNFFYIDITLRYGSNDVVNAILGSDSSKYVENLIAFDPNILKDTDYTANPDFSECKVAKLQLYRKNQFDEVCDLNRAMNTDGSTYSANGYLTSHNKLRVLPNNRYIIRSPWYDSMGVGIAMWDANDNYVGYLQAVAWNGTAANPLNYTFVIPMNVRFVKFFIHYKNGAISAYGDDICLQLYWDGSDLEYKPFKNDDYSMPNTATHGILKVVDGKVVADGDRLTPDGSENSKRYKLKDDFTLDNNDALHYTNVWYYVITKPNDYYSYNNYETSSGMRDRLRVNKYRIDSVAGDDAGNIGCVRGDIIPTAFCIGFAPNTTLEQARASFSGFKMIYLLAQPETLTAPTFASSFWGDDFGTMWLLDEDGNVIDGMAGMNIKYNANIGGFAESLYIEADGDPEYFAAASGLTDASLNARGYYKMQDFLIAFGANGMVGGTLRQTLANAKSLDFDNTSCIDLGDLTWTYSDGIFMTNKPAGSISWTQDDVPAPVLCTNYKTVGRDYIGSYDKAIAWKSEIRVRDITYTNVADFKNAMKGVLVAYPKVLT